MAKNAFESKQVQLQLSLSCQTVPRTVATALKSGVMISPLIKVEARYVVGCR